MKRIVFFALSLLPVLAAAQPKVRIDRSPTLGVSYMLENKTRPGMVTVLVKLRDLRNTYAPSENRYLSTQSGDIYRFEVANNMTRFLSLRPIDKSKPVGYGAGVYDVYEGCISSEVDTAFVYRMPCTTMHPVRVRRLTGSEKMPRTGNVRYAFRCEAGDTVYAARRGIVIRLTKPRERDIDLSTLKSTSERTRLTVEHSDGSMVCYSGFAEWLEPFVSEGDEVLPGQPLGLVGGLTEESDGRYYVLQFLCYRWMFTDENASIERFPKVAGESIVPRFATTEGAIIIPDKGEYRAVMNDELLTREMTKREVKKLKGNKK
ncbi:MAG: M23 family metallopeptidase [Alistipes sp.]|nr:M23 family metallopeptidase [Alistipes sp.]